jgi:hypothetical protein
VEVPGGFVEASFFGNGGGVDDEDDAANGLGVRELCGSIVSQLAVAGRVKQEEAARALKGWVAGGAVVRGRRDVGAGEERFDGERLRGRVGLGNGVAFGLGTVSLIRSLAAGIDEAVRRTKVVNAVFPLPLGPTSRKVGIFVVAAACLYRKLCSSIGSPSATRTVMMMVVRLGENAAVSQLSSSYHAMTARYSLSCTPKQRFVKVARVVGKQRIDVTCRSEQGQRVVDARCFSDDVTFVGAAVAVPPRLRKFRRVGGRRPCSMSCHVP